METNPFVANLLEGGKLVRYGAKSLPYGGWYAMPRNYFDGGLIIGDAGSFLDSQKLKGIHLAIKSGMLAAETAFEALKAGDTSAKTLSAFQSKIENSYIKKELWKVATSIRASRTANLPASSTPRSANYWRTRPRRSMRAHAATKPTRKSTASSPSRVSRETANSLSTALPTSIIPARATKKISLAICTSRI